MVFNDWDSLAETRSGLAPEGVVQNPALKLLIRMRKVIETSNFLMYVERPTSKAFGCGIVLRNRGNRFLSDFQEAVIFEDWGDLVEDRGDLSGQPRSSQPEVDFEDSGEPEAGPEKYFKGK